MRGDSNERLTILSEAEKTALYGIPSFDDFQRIEFFAMTEAERSLALQRRGILKQVYCLLQIGYFKAKQAFFQFSLDDVPPEDVTFLLQRYFPGETLTSEPLSTKEYYAQRREIVALFGFRLWTDNDQQTLRDKAKLLARTDVTPAFLLAELMIFLIGQRIVRPGYSTLQTIIRDALSAERERLEQLVEAAITDDARKTLELLLANESTLSELAALKQDAKSFRYRQMGLERQKRLTLKPLYAIAKKLLPSLDVSQRNIAYYASLANFYTVYDLRRFKPAKTNLYLLCYAWQRYRQLTDNVVEAFGYQTRQLEDETKAAAIQQAAKLHVERQQATPRVGELLLLYVDDALPDVTPFGDVRHKAFRIMPQDKLRSTGKLLTEKPVSQMDLRWHAVDKQSGLCTKNLRPLATALEFASSSAGGKVWLAALKWMKDVFARQQSLAKQPLSDVPPGTLPKRLRDFLQTFDQDGKPLACMASGTNLWSTGNCANASMRATSILTTACSTDVFLMTWCPWRPSPKRSRRSTFHGCASRLMKHWMLSLSNSTCSGARSIRNCELASLSIWILMLTRKRSSGTAPRPTRTSSCKRVSMPSSRPATLPMSSGLSMKGATFCRQ